MVLLGPPFLFACSAILDAYLAVAMTELSIIQYYLRDFLCDPLLLVLNDVLILGPRNLSFLKLEVLSPGGGPRTRQHSWTQCFTFQTLVSHFYVATRSCQ